MLLSALLATLSVGCTWVSQDDYDAQLGTLDEDGDGVTRAEGDCDDDDDDIYPGREETWYDGVDSDCAGDDDDDADADGDPVESDCDDQNPDRYTGATETWYDGVDSDCAGDDDFDADGDGWPTDDADPDCADDDPEIHPGALEDLTDITDHDCDGGPKSFRAQLLDWGLSGANNLRLVEGFSSLTLSWGALESVEDPSNESTSHHDQPSALSLNPADPREILETLPWYQASTTLDPPYSATTGLDLLATGEVLYGSTGARGLDGTTRSLELTSYDPERPEPRRRATSDQSVNADFSDLALARSMDGILHAIGCDDDVGTLQYARTSIADQDAETITNDFLVEGVMASTCSLYLDAFTGEARIGFTDTGTGEYVIWAFDPSTIFPALIEDPSTTFDEQYRTPFYAPIDLEYPPLSQFTEVLADGPTGNVVVKRGPSVLEIVPTTPALSANATEAGGTLYVTWVEEGGHVGVAWGDNLGIEFDEASVTVDFVPTEATPLATVFGSWLIVGVLSDDEIALGVVPIPATAPGGGP